MVVERPPPVGVEKVAQTIYAAPYKEYDGWEYGDICSAARRVVDIMEMYPVDKDCYFLFSYEIMAAGFFQWMLGHPRSIANTKENWSAFVRYLQDYSGGTITSENFGVYWPRMAMYRWVGPPRQPGASIPALSVAPRQPFPAAPSGVCPIDDSGPAGSTAGSTAGSSKSSTAAGSKASLPKGCASDACFSGFLTDPKEEDSERIDKWVLERLNGEAWWTWDKEKKKGVLRGIQDSPQGNDPDMEKHVLCPYGMYFSLDKQEGDPILDHCYHHSPGVQCDYKMGQCVSDTSDCALGPVKGINQIYMTWFQMGGKAMADPEVARAYISYVLLFCAGTQKVARPGITGLCFPLLIPDKNNMIYVFPNSTVPEKWTGAVRDRYAEWLVDNFVSPCVNNRGPDGLPYPIRPGFMIYMNVKNSNWENVFPDGVKSVLDGSIIQWPTTECAITSDGPPPATCQRGAWLGDYSTCVLFVWSAMVQFVTEHVIESMKRKNLPMSLWLHSDKEWCNCGSPAVTPRWSGKGSASTPG